MTKALLTAVGLLLHILASEQHITTRNSNKCELRNVIVSPNPKRIPLLMNIEDVSEDFKLQSDKNGLKKYVSKKGYFSIVNRNKRLQVLYRNSGGEVEFKVDLTAKLIGIRDTEYGREFVFELKFPTQCTTYIAMYYDSKKKKTFLTEYEFYYGSTDGNQRIGQKLVTD